MMCHDWERVTLNVDSFDETGLHAGPNELGCAGGAFRQRPDGTMETDQDMAGLAGMPKGVAA